MHPVKTIVSYPRIIPHHQTNTEFLERPWILPSGQPLIAHMYKNHYEGISFVPGRLLEGQNKLSAVLCPGFTEEETR